MSIVDEPEKLGQFRSWFEDNGGFLHPGIYFSPDESGMSVRTREDMPANSTVVSCPFSLAITVDVARAALTRLLHAPSFENWTERQLICSYICMHWIVDTASDVLRHQPYLDILPKMSDLRTSLHFTDAEIAAFKGTNIYGATLDRRKEWYDDWVACHFVVKATNNDWGTTFTWERYLTAATYLSSRAFPSTLLSASPSLVTTPSSYPILLPGVDSLNHARGHPVTWHVSGPGSHNKHSDAARAASPSVSLVLHVPTAAGGELRNNYGPKSNAELILGYGFSLAANPDDTIALKLAGALHAREVARGAHGADALWGDVQRALGADDLQAADGLEGDLQAADSLACMVDELRARFPAEPVPASVRPEVAVMWRHYVEGQRSILESILEFVRGKEEDAMRQAREQGIEIVMEDEDE